MSDPSGFEKRTRDRLVKRHGCTVEKLKDSHTGLFHGTDAENTTNDATRFSTTNPYDFRVCRPVGDCCPFCGSPDLATFFAAGSPPTVWRAVECGDCGAPGPVGHGPGAIEADSDAWVRWRGIRRRWWYVYAIECKSRTGDRFEFSLISGDQRKGLLKMPPGIPALVLIEMRSHRRCFFIPIARLLEREKIKKSFNITRGDFDRYATECPRNTSPRERLDYYDLSPLLDGDEPGECDRHVPPAIATLPPWEGSPNR